MLVTFLICELFLIDTTTSHTTVSRTACADDATVYERELPDSSKIFDDVHSKIYIKKIQPMVKNKGERSYDVMHACIYCKKLVASIQSHLEHVHKHEESVEMCLSLKIKIDGCRNPETKKGGSSSCITCKICHATKAITDITLILSNKRRVNF